MTHFETQYKLGAELSVTHYCPLFPFYVPIAKWNNQFPCSHGIFFPPWKLKSPTKPPIPRPLWDILVTPFPACCAQYFALFSLFTVEHPVHGGDAREPISIAGEWLIATRLTISRLSALCHVDGTHAFFHAPGAQLTRKMSPARTALPRPVKRDG